MKRGGLRNLLVILVILLVLTIPTEYYVVEEAQAASAGATLTPLQEGFMTHINHIIFVVMENHAYDSYFGTYCQVKSKLCPMVTNGIPNGTCVPENPALMGGPCVKPWNYTAANWTLPDMWHTYNSSYMAWNNGAMNGFYNAEEYNSLRYHCGTCGSPLNTLGHYNGTTAPSYWDLAEEYTIYDNFFSSVLSYSLPNHWHIVAGQSPQVVIAGTLGPKAGVKVNVNSVISTDHLYLNESNHTRSVEDLLLNSSVSWNYYDGALASTYQKAIAVTTNANRTEMTGYGSAYGLWNPQAAKAESYNLSFAHHFVSNTRFYTDARNGNFPDLSWVIPPGQDSDHPPYNSTVAQSYVVSLVDALESSPEWNSSVMYITWDDYGGFYDHVDPPVFQGQQLGFRVPLLVISPYSVKGSIAPPMTYFESVLHLMEWRFGLGCVATLDCRAPLPLGGYNFTKAPRAPILFPTNFSQVSYPFNPNWNGTAGVVFGSYVPPAEFTYFPDGQLPDID